MDERKCEGCPLQGVSEPSQPIGREDAPYMIVTDTPTKFAADKGQLMGKNGMTVLARGLEAAGFKKHEFQFVPQIRCPHEADGYTTKEKRLIQKTCRAHLIDEVAACKPTCIIPLGGEPTKQVMGRAIKISKIHGVSEYSEELGTHVLPFLSPGQVAMYPQHIPSFNADIATLVRLEGAEFDQAQASASLFGKYKIIDDLEFLIEQNPKVIFFDTENTSLEYFKEGPDDVRTYDPEIHDKSFNPSAAILTMQFCIKPGEAYMLVWDHPERPTSQRRKKALKGQLRRLLCREGVKVVGQNLKYDTTYLAACTGIRIKVSSDTLMMAALLDENMISKGQDALVKRYVPEMAGYADEFNATTDKSRMWEVPLHKLINYGCGDVDSGLRLYRKMWAELRKDERLRAHYDHVSIPGINTFASIELGGIHVDHAALAAFEAIMAESVEAQYQALLAQVPKAIKRVHIDAGLKFSRGDFVRDILFNHKGGFRLKPKVFTKTTARLPPDKRIPSTSSKDHLPYFFDECPFTMQLAAYIKDERLLGTNVRGFQKKYIHEELVRPTYSLWTTVTGRSSSENPNGQNFPKRGPNATAYRRIFVAPPGYAVLEADLNQAELRISADMANDPTMLRIYRNKGDIHTATALIVMQITMEEFKALPKSEQKAARSKAKAVNFGFIYGMGWRKFIGYAKTQYGVEFTDEEAQRIRIQFFEKYDMLPGWHEAMREFARKHKYVRSYSGRIRHLPMIDSDDEGTQAEAGRQAINSPVQEFGSSLGIMAIGRMHEEIDPKYLQPIAFVHDAIYCYVPLEYVEWGAKTLKWYMESNDIEEWFGVRMKCPIVADVSFGMNFGDTIEMGEIDLDAPYDFEALWAANPDSRIDLPPQLEPENYGFRETPYYDLVD